MKAYRKEFRRADGTTVICEHDGARRLPTRYFRNSKEISPTPTGAKPAKPPAGAAKRTPERTTPKRETRYDCVHLEGSAGETTRHLCGGCPGGQIATVFTCELFGECLPAAWAPTPDSNARRCVGCGKYQPGERL